MAAVLLFCLGASSVLTAQEIGEKGIGDTEEQARSAALANLSSRLYVQVEAKITEVSGEENYKSYARTFKEITTSSNLPILGHKFLPSEKIKKEYVVSVVLEAAKALPLYEDKLNSLLIALNEAKPLIEKNKGDSFAYEQLLSAKNKLEEFDTHRFIYRALGGRKEFLAPFTEGQLATALNALLSDFEDLEQALKVSVKKLAKYSKIYAFYPSVYPSEEVTGFSRAVHGYLLTLLATTEKPEAAQFYLRSSYEIHKSGINLTLRLIDLKANILESVLIKLKPKAYADYEVQPKTYDLAQQIATGEIISNKLNISLAGLDGNSQLFFTKGQTAQFKIKANLPAEYFIVVHTHTREGVYSYLLELSPTFTKRIPAEDTNRWMILDPFEVVAPFGVETLQVFATTGDISKMLPPVKRDPITGLYKISDNPRDAVALTRGLKPKAKQVETTEANLTITTMEK